MLKITLNGEQNTVQSSTLMELLVELSLHQKRIAVEHNKEIVPRGELETTTLKDGDRVEIVHAIGGG